MSEYESYKIKQDSNKYLTEEEIRALLNSTLNNLSTPVRLVAGSIQGTGAEPWELTPSEMNIKLSENSEQSIQGWTNTLTFSSVDYNTVQWTSGDITLSGGKVYSITAGNTGSMSALTYIYLDVGVSETALQTTTTATDSVGSGKILIAVAENNSDSTSDAIFQVFGGSGGILLTTDNLAANSITTNELAANSVTANKISVSQLSAISANLGTITAGTVTGATIQTATSGARCIMTSSNGYQFYYDNNFKGKIIADNTAGIIYDTNGSSHFFRKGGTEYAQINDDGLLLPSSHKITFSGGSVLTDQGSKLECDRVFECTNISPKGTSQDIGSGGDKWRNAYINGTIYMGNAGKREANNATVEYNPGNAGNDAKWESVGNKRMQLNQSGNLSIDGSYSDGGADFAEMFESNDGKEIQAGTSVFLVGDKIRPAKKGEEPIGVISATPTIIGNAVGADTDEHWTGKYEKDEFGRYITEKAEWWELDHKKIVKKGKTKITPRDSDYSDVRKPPKGAKTKQVIRRKINPKWDSNIKYKPRKDRPEWNIVGLIGRVRIKKGQPIAKNWIKLKTISKNVDEYLIR